MAVARKTASDDELLPAKAVREQLKQLRGQLINGAGIIKENGTIVMHRNSIFGRRLLKRRNPMSGYTIEEFIQSAAQASAANYPFELENPYLLEVNLKAP